MYECLKRKKKLNTITQTMTFCQNLLNLINFKQEITFFKDTFKLLTKKRDNNARTLLHLLFGAYFVGSTVSMGISSIQYLYLVKKPIYFTQTEYGLFKALNILFRTISLLIILPVLKHFNFPDYYLIIFSISSELLNLVFYSVASFLNYLIWFGKFVFFVLNLNHNFI